LSGKITDFERTSAEAFADIPTERQVLDLICRTVAEVERARLEWLASFLPRPAPPVADPGRAVGRRAEKPVRSCFT
jgi:hypothetical protein